MVNGTRSERATGKRKDTRTAKGNALGTRRPRTTTKRQAGQHTTQVQTVTTPQSGIMRDNVGKAKPTSETRSAKRAYTPSQTTPAERIAAVTAALTANREHPTGSRALDAACLSLGRPIHVSTLHDWLQLYRGQIEATLPVIDLDETIKSQHNKTLADMIKARDIAVKQLLDENKAKGANYRDNGVVAGILHDKIENATALPANIVDAVLAFVKICDALGFPAEQLIRDNTNRLIGLQQRRLMADSTAMLSPGESDQDR